MSFRIPFIDVSFVVYGRSGSSVLEECLEFLYLVSTASDAGVTTLYESGSLKIIASWMLSMPDGNTSHCLLNLIDDLVVGC